MKTCPNYIKRTLILLLAGVWLAIGGCEGTDTRDKVDDTVKELTGKKNVERYQQMKDDIGKIQNQQEERYRQLDEDGKDE